MSKEVQQFYWFVMDGRAKHDPDEAAVYETIGDRDPITSRDSVGNVKCGAMEFIREIQ